MRNAASNAGMPPNSRWLPASSSNTASGDSTTTRGADGPYKVDDLTAGKYGGDVTYEFYKDDGTSVFLDDGEKAKGKWKNMPA